MNMKICNSLIIFLLLDCIFILHQISKTGWELRRRDIRAPFIFIIKPAQVDWNPHSNSHKRQKTKTFIRLIHNASFEKKLFGSRKT